MDNKEIQCLDEWVEFNVNSKYINIRREFIIAVKEMDEKTTVLYLKNGKDIVVDMEYEKVMEMV